MTDLTRSRRARPRRRRAGGHRRPNRRLGRRGPLARRGGCAGASRPVCCCSSAASSAILASLAAGWWLAGRAVRPVERAYEAQAGFAADASHELRTPLTFIRSGVEVLAERDPELGRDVLSEVDYLTGLTQRLLLLARAERGTVTLERGPVDVAAVCRSAARTERGAHADALSLDGPGRLVALGDRVGTRGRPGRGPRERARSTVAARRSCDGRRDGQRGDRVGRGPRARARAEAARIARSSDSSAPTRRGPARPAAPGWAWRSRAPWSRRRAAGCGSSRRPVAGLTAKRRALALRPATGAYFAAWTWPRSSRGIRRSMRSAPDELAAVATVRRDRALRRRAP